MTEKYISTFEAAKRMSVTPDTVLKWIKAGILEARRTPGGHHRISAKKIEALIENGEKSKKKKRFQYCWEFNAQGKMCTKRCEDCVVFKSSAKRCYTLFNMSEGHLKLFCETSCEKCDYYIFTKSVN